MPAGSDAPERPEFDPRTAVSVGRILSARGLKGELKVQPLTDFPSRFDRGSCLWLDGRQVKVEGRRWVQDSVYLRLEGIETRAAAEALRGKELQAAEPQPIIEQGRYYLHDVIGLRVLDSQGVELGRLQDVMTTGANDVFVVQGERGELLLPAIEDVIARIDLDAKQIVVNLPPGLEFRPHRRRPA